jgi:hypothetical protein
MPTDSRIIVEEMEVVPSSSDLQQLQKSYSKTHGKYYGLFYLVPLILYIKYFCLELNALISIK